MLSTMTLKLFVGKQYYPEDKFYISSNDKLSVSILYFGNSLCLSCSTLAVSNSGLKFFFCRFTSATTA